MLFHPPFPSPPPLHLRFLLFEPSSSPSHHYIPSYSHYSRTSPPFAFKAPFAPACLPTMSRLRKDDARGKKRKKRSTKRDKVSFKGSKDNFDFTYIYVVSSGSSSSSWEIRRDELPADVSFDVNY